MDLATSLIAVLLPGIESVRQRVSELYHNDADLLISTVRGRLCSYIPRVLELIRTPELSDTERALSCIVESWLNAGRAIEEFKATFIRASDRVTREELGVEIDSRLKTHSRFVADICAEIAQELGMSDGECTVFRRGGYLHDIGKVFSFGAYEFREDAQSGFSHEANMAILRTHASLGALLLRSMFPAFEREEIFVREHQERLNGNGCPSGIDSGQISLEGKTAYLADMLDIYVNRFDPARSIGDAVATLVNEFAEHGLEADPVLQAFETVGKRRQR